MAAFSQTLNKLVIIQAPSVGRDEGFQPIDVWTPVAAPWANIKTKGGMETIRAGAVTSGVQASIRLRYREDIDSSMRVVHGPTIYKILAVLLDTENRLHVDLVCEAVLVPSV